MDKRTTPPAITAVAAAFLALSACATTRLYSETQLSDVARACGAAAGEVVQEAELPQVLFLYAVAPPPDQRRCVQRWANQRGLRLAYIDAIDFKDQ